MKINMTPYYLAIAKSCERLAEWADEIGNPWGARQYRRQAAANLANAIGWASIT